MPGIQAEEMRTALAVVILALAPACTMEAPASAPDSGADAASELDGGTRFTEVEPPAGVFVATAIVVTHYTEEADVDGIPEPRIHWTEEALSYDGEPVGGLTYSCDEIWVHWDPGTISLSRTSLAHELAHCAIGIKYGDPDADHSVQFGYWNPGGFVQQANDRIEAAGL